MRYKINPVLSMQAIDDKTVIAEIDFDIKGFSTKSNVLIEIIKLFEDGNDIDVIYKKYQDIYERGDVETFVDILINEKILVEETAFVMNLHVAFIGEEKYFEYLKELTPPNIKFHLWNEDCIDKIEGMDCIIYAPGNANYKNAIDINRNLYKKNIPYIVFRFDGSSGIVGPHVIPWQTSCLECCIRQRLRRFFLKYEEEIDIQDIYLLSFAKNYSRDDDTFLKVCFQKLINEIIYTMDTSDRQPSLINREVIIPFDNFELITNTYTPTSDCMTCNNINQKRQFWCEEKELSVPTFVNPFSYGNIVYKTGGLRSVGREQARKLLDVALKSLDLKIEIQIDEDNSFFDIAPVYHSHLKKL